MGVENGDKPLPAIALAELGYAKFKRFGSGEAGGPILPQLNLTEICVTSSWQLHMRLLSPAKINLFLHITGKRPDGYHNLVTLMCCIGLYDTILLTFCVERTSVSCVDPKVPKDETNLASKAANLFLESLGRNEGVKIFIDKQIPVAAGLGGGSGNAATVLLGLNRYYGYPFSQEKLISMGLSVGADVPFFILQKPAIASGIGEKLEDYRGLEPFQVLLLCPEFDLSTAKVYKDFDRKLTRSKKKLPAPS